MGFLAVCPSGVAAQVDSVVLNGRVEDAVTQTPLWGALVIAGDSTGAVYTDSTGAFALPVEEGGAYLLFAEMFGYELTEFELGPSAPDQRSVLRLAPLTSDDGVTVVDDVGFAVLVEGLDRRRDRYTGRVRTYRRDDLERFTGRTVRDFLSRTLPDATPCDGVPQLLCRGGRYDRGDEVNPVLVCLDERIAPRGDFALERLPMASVARVELYAPETGWGLVGNPFRGGQVRIYTIGWMIERSGASPHALRPLRTGC